MLRLKRDHPLSLCFKPGELLRVGILGRRLCPHQRLPFEPDWRTHFGVSRIRLAKGLLLANAVARWRCLDHLRLLRHKFASESLHTASARPRQATQLSFAPPIPALILERSAFTAPDELVEYVQLIDHGDSSDFGPAGHGDLS